MLRHLEIGSWDPLSYERSPELMRCIGCFPSLTDLSVFSDLDRLRRRFRCLSDPDLSIVVLTEDESSAPLSKAGTGPF